MINVSLRIVYGMKDNIEDDNEAAEQIYHGCVVSCRRHRILWVPHPAFRQLLVHVDLKHEYTY